MRGMTMTKSKKLLYKSTWGILIFLIICTFLSKSISEAIMPVVEVIKPLTMTLEFDGEQREFYSSVIPMSAIISGANNTKNVYVVRQRKGLFGQEYYTVLMEVQIVTTNSIYAAIGGRNVTAIDDIVISQSTYLTSGEVVKVISQ